MAGFGVPLVAAATAAATAIGVYYHLHSYALEIRWLYNRKAKELGADEERASRKNRGGLLFAPQFDGLHCYENLISSRTNF
ncbi:hypothetical protein SUGI_0541480 [Cryptomeria japonica]|nr:hypothetical protein SUGI_0541480 [Cryptomeria japonica]